MTVEPRLLPEETSVEWELLLRCAATKLTPAVATEVAALCTVKPDWKVLCQSAEAHGLLPLLCRNLRALDPELVPPQVLASLTDRFHANIARNLLLTDELLRILDVFAAGGVSAIPFKGPVLASLAYGSVDVRQFGDLDLLVAPRQLLLARDLLVQHGFDAFPKLSPAKMRVFMRSECELWFGEPRELVSVETHWAIREPVYCLPFDVDQLFARANTTTLNGRQVPSFAPEDLLLIVAAHGAKHRWDKLKLVCDVAEVLRSQPELQWPVVLEQARQLHAERILRVALRLAAEYLAAPLPAEIAAWSWRDRTLPALLPLLRAQWYALRSKRLQEKELRMGLYLRLRERWQDRAAYVLGTVFTPTQEDWNSVALPDPLCGLYHLVRPVRLTGKYLRKALKRGASGRF